jgi:addiction module RelE/StbE family toxin
MKIIFSAKFQRQYKKLPKHIRQSVIKKGNIFQKNPFDSSLKTHKLHGRFNGFWAFSVGYDVRIIFEFKSKKTIWFYTIGKHNIYE